MEKTIMEAAGPHFTNISENPTMEVSDPHFTNILEGKKPVEGRKMSPTWAHLKEGDDLVITNGDRKFVARITKINKYYPMDNLDSKKDVLDAYLEGETLAAVLPGVSTHEEGRNIYLGFHELEDIKKWGFMGIHLSLDTSFSSLIH